MTWINRNAQAIQAVAAVVTAVTAVLAVAGVLIQMRAADDTSRAQTAREAYAAHLLAAVSNPDMAEPADACALIASPKGAAYAAYVDHLLYASELMLEAEPDWAATFGDSLAPHATLVCNGADAGAFTPDMTAMLEQFRAGTCPDTPTCAEVPPT